MSVDTSARRRAPGAVIAAAILLAFSGGLLGLALVTLGALQIGDNDFALGILLVGLLVIAFVAVCGWGMTRGDRGGQIVAVIFGGLMFVGSLYGLGQGQPISLLWLAFGAAVVLLVVAPVSSRDWFAGQAGSDSSR